MEGKEIERRKRIAGRSRLNLSSRRSGEKQREAGQRGFCWFIWSLNGTWQASDSTVSTVIYWYSLAHTYINVHSFSRDLTHKLHPLVNATRRSAGKIGLKIAKASKFVFVYTYKTSNIFRYTYRTKIKHISKSSASKCAYVNNNHHHDKCINHIEKMVKGRSHTGK